MNYDTWKATDQREPDAPAPTCGECGDDLRPCEGRLCATCAALEEVEEVEEVEHRAGGNRPHQEESN